MTTENNRLYIGRVTAKRDYLEIASAVTDEDATVDALIRAVSEWVEGHEGCGRRFYPVEETRNYDHPFTDTTILEVDADLLSVSTLKTSNGGTTITSGDYYLQDDEGHNETPYDHIVLKGGGTQKDFAWTGTPQKANSVEGSWGFQDVSRATGSTLSGEHNSSVTTVAVSDGDDFEVGWMILIGTEQMFVSGISGNNLTVVRQQNGTTAATHLTGVAISRQLPPRDIEALCGIMAARLHSRGVTAWADYVAGFGGTRESGVAYLKALPAEARAIMLRYRRKPKLPAGMYKV